jgi:Flp pilus assembly protein CpaB
MNCHKCGKNLPENLDYCPTCKIIENKEAELRKQEEPKNPPEPIPELNNEKKKSVFFPALVMLIILSVSGYFGWQHFIVEVEEEPPPISEPGPTTSPNSGQMVEVPFALVTIQAGTLITAEMIGTKEVSLGTVAGDPTIITWPNRIIGKYTRENRTIQEGAIFSTGLLWTEMKADSGSGSESIPNNYSVFSLKVDNNVTFNNAIMPNDIIDVYIQATDDDRKPIYSLMNRDVEIIRVLDRQGNNAFGPNSIGTAAQLLFAVPNADHQILLRASQVTTNSLRIVPAPKFRRYSGVPRATEISKAEMIAFINSRET